MRTTAEDLLQNAPALSIGLLAGDPLRLGDGLATLDAAGVELVHVDVMDGVFCPQMAGSPSIVAALPDRYVKDVHLMIDEPLDKLTAYVDAGAGILTFQVEATRHPHWCLRSLAGCGVVRGIAVNPGTPIASVEPLLDELELLLVLGIDPGRGGQVIIPSIARRLGAARTMMEGRPIALGIDGGVTARNIGTIAALGVDLIVTGSAIFASADPVETTQMMLAATHAGAA
jgi:ribulose-phosphate 3-epimerase